MFVCFDVVCRFVCFVFVLVSCVCCLFVLVWYVCCLFCVCFLSCIYCLFVLVSFVSLFCDCLFVWVCMRRLGSGKLVLSLFCVFVCECV